MICPVCKIRTNSRGEPLYSYNAVTLHIAGKILSDDALHRIWFKRHAPKLDLTGWSKKSSNYKNINELAELIYPVVELALDEAYETDNTQSTSMAGSQTITPNHVADMARELNRILDAVDTEGKQYTESIIARIQRLNRSSHVPRQVAALMCVIREYRNVAEHELKGLSDDDVEAIKASWKLIHKWASETIKQETFNRF